MLTPLSAVQAPSKYYGDLAALIFVLSSSSHSKEIRSALIPAMFSGCVFEVLLLTQAVSCFQSSR